MTNTEMAYFSIEVGVVFFVLGAMVSFIIVDEIKENNKIPKCQHKNKHTYIDWTAVTCEKTTITCLDCGKKFKTKVEC